MQGCGAMKVSAAYDWFSTVTASWQDHLDGFGFGSEIVRANSYSVGQQLILGLGSAVGMGSKGGAKSRCFENTDLWAKS